MQFYFPYQFQDGIVNVVGPPTSSELELSLMRLANNSIVDQRAREKESVLVILGGSCSLVLDGELHWENLGERSDVFSGRATAAYVPRNSSYRVVAGATGVEIAVVRAATEKVGQPYVVRPEGIAVVSRGKNNWQREVHNIIDSTHPADKLLVGETFNVPGGWSSYPPHKHDVHNPPHETRLQEIYHFRVQSESGFGVQRMYSHAEGLDETYTVRHGDSVFIPFGFHTVCAAAGYRLYYLWALAGSSRELKWQSDPSHAWIERE